MVRNAHGEVTSELARLTVVAKHEFATTPGEVLANVHAQQQARQGQGYGYDEFGGWRGGSGSGYTYTTYPKTTPSMTCISDDLQVSAVPTPPAVVARGKPAVHRAAAEALAHEADWWGMEV